MTYHLVGFASAFFVFLSLFGLAAQVLLVFKRKKQIACGELVDEQATSILSVTRFSTSYLAFFTMFMYGLTLDDFNYYLVLPRIFALLLLLMILYQIMRDKKDVLSLLVFSCGSLMLLLVGFLGFSEQRATFFYDGFPQVAVVISGGFLLWGLLAQMQEIRQSGRTGGLSLPMHQLFLVKDISSLFFGFLMGFQHGWPVMVVHTIGFIVQTTTMWHFRWVKYSKSAELRRTQG